MIWNNLPLSQVWEYILASMPSQQRTISVLIGWNKTEKYFHWSVSCQLKHFKHIPHLYMNGQVYAKSVSVQVYVQHFKGIHRKYLPHCIFCENHSLGLWMDRNENRATAEGSLNTLQWSHNGRDSVSNHHSHDCLLNHLFRRRPKIMSKLRVTGHSEGNSPVTGELPAQMTSNAENVSIWWRHHDNTGR